MLSDTAKKAWECLPSTDNTISLPDNGLKLIENTGFFNLYLKAGIHFVCKKVSLCNLACSNNDKNECVKIAAARDDKVIKTQILKEVPADFSTMKSFNQFNLLCNEEFIIEETTVSFTVSEPSKELEVNYIISQSIREPHCGIDRRCYFTGKLSCVRFVRFDFDI